MTMKSISRSRHPCASVCNTAFGGAIEVTIRAVLSFIGITLICPIVLKLALQSEAKQSPEIAEGIFESLVADIVAGGAVLNRDFRDSQIAAIGFDLGLEERAARFYPTRQNLL